MTSNEKVLTFVTVNLSFVPHTVETAPACDNYLSSAGPCVAESAGWLTDGVDVRRQRPQRAAPVLLDGFWGIELGDVVVGVHRDQDVGHERLDEEQKRRRGANVNNLDGRPQPR